MSLSIDERFGLDIEPEQPPHPFFLAGKAAGRKEALADVLRFLRAEERKFEKGGREMQSAASRERCGIRASLLTTLIVQIDRGDHEREP